MNQFTNTIRKDAAEHVETDVVTRPWGHRTFFVLNLAEHEICLANKSQISNCKL